MTTRRTPGADALHTATPVAEPLYALRLDPTTLRLAMSVDETAAITGRTKREIYDAIDRGDLTTAPCSGRRHLITVQGLLAYLGLLPDQPGQHRKTA